MNALITMLAQDKAEGGGLLSILILVLPLGALFYLMIVPQRKQRAKHQAFVSSLSVGDEVVTSGGVYGTINLIEGNIVHLEVDSDVVIRVALSSLSRAASEPEVPVRGGGSASSTPDDGDAADEKHSGS